MQENSGLTPSMPCKFGVESRCITEGLLLSAAVSDPASLAAAREAANVSFPPRSLAQTLAGQKKLDIPRFRAFLDAVADQLPPSPIRQALVEDGLLASLLVEKERLPRRAVEEAWRACRTRSADGDPVRLAKVLCDADEPTGETVRAALRELERAWLVCGECESVLARDDVRSGGQTPCPICSRTLAVAEELTRPDGALSLPFEEVKVGEVVGHYRVEGLIGKGGMGTVYRACDLRLGRMLALKFLPRVASDDRKAVDRFIHEAKALARLTCENIVQVYDVDQWRGQYYLAMQYVDGTDLQRLLKDRGPIAPGQALDMMLQVLRALAVAHGQKVIHRDIKPGNILLRNDGVALLVDFGLALLAEGETSALTRTGENPFTAYYVSPEQADGQRASVQSDLYSLGATFYHLVTGTPPFTGPTPWAIIVARLREQPKPACEVARGVPKSLSRVIERLMARAPADRYPDVGSVVRDLEKGPERGPATTQEVVAAVARQQGVQPALPTGNTCDGAASRDDSTGSRLRGVKILLANSNVDERRRARDHLAGLGAQVLEAGTGPQALATVMETRGIGAVVASLQLPLIGGLDLCRKIKERPALSGIPVLLCSELVSRRTVLDANQRGAATLLVGPMDSGDMIAKLEQHIRVVQIARDSTRRRKSSNNSIAVRFGYCPLHAPPEPCRLHLLRPMSQVVEIDIFDIDRYLGARPGRVPVNYLLLEVQVCPSCFFASTDPGDFLDSESGTSGWASAGCRELLAKTAAARHDIAAAISREFFQESRSPEDAILAHRLHIQSALARHQGEDEREPLHLVRCGLSSLKMAQIHRTVGRSPDFVDVALREARGYLESAYGRLEGPNLVRVAYQLVALSCWFGERSTGAKYFEFLRERTLKAETKGAEKAHRFLSGYMQRARDVWENQETIRDRYKA